jgi:hypothetical protein
MPKLPPTVKRLLSIAFFASLVYFGARVFSVESADCEIVFTLRGPELETLQELEVRLYDGENDEAIGEFRQYFQKGSTAPLGRWPLVVAEGKYRVECDLRSEEGSFTVTLPVKLVDGEAVSVYIEAPGSSDLE